MGQWDPFGRRGRRRGWAHGDARDERSSEGLGNGQTKATRQSQQAPGRARKYFQRDFNTIQNIDKSWIDLDKW